MNKSAEEFKLLVKITEDVRKKLKRAQDHQSFGKIVTDVSRGLPEVSNALKISCDMFDELDSSQVNILEKGLQKLEAEMETYNELFKKQN